jgi:hypothetical protein
MKLLPPRKINKLLRKKRLRKFLIVALIVLLMGWLVVYTVHKLNSPANGTISVSHTNSAAITDSTDYSTLNNDYFSVLYPSELTPDFAQQKSSAYLVYNFMSKRDAAQNLTDSLEIYVKTLPYGGVAADSDYRSYQSQPGLYKLSQKFIRGELVDVATRDAGSNERVGLWVHGNYLMILKLKSTTKDGIDTKFTTILKSIQWLKS